MYDCMIHDQISEASLNNGRELWKNIVSRN
jgi:hypothetical protein